MMKIVKLLIQISLAFLFMQNPLWATAKPAKPLPTQPIFALQHWQTKNGATVLFVRAPNNPMVNISVAFRIGSVRDGAFPGLATLTTTMLNQGAGNLGVNTLANNFDKVGAQFGENTTRTANSLSLKSLTKQNLLTPALNNFQLILTSPTFPEAALQREKTALQTAIANRQQNPANIATDKLYAMLYGAKGYGHPVLGTQKGVKAITREQIMAFYKSYFVAKNAVVAIVGDVSQPQAKAIANKLVGQLPAGQLAPPIFSVAKAQNGTVQTLFYPATQTAIRMGQLGVTRKDPHYFSLVVGNYILGGGGFSSRLMEEIREKRGLSYYTSSYFAPLPGKGPFIIALATRNQKASDAIAITQKVTQQFLKVGPNPDEIKAAKQYLMGSFPLKLDSNRAITEALVNIGIHHLPLDFYNTYRQKIAAVTKASIQQAFQHHIMPKKWMLVRVGGSEKK